MSGTFVPRVGGFDGFLSVLIQVSYLRRLWVSLLLSTDVISRDMGIRKEMRVLCDRVCKRMRLEEKEISILSRAGGLCFFC